MSSRTDSGRVLATYLRSHTGSPLWRFEHPYRDMQAPLGLSLRVSTERKTQEVMEMSRALSDTTDLAAVAWIFGAKGNIERTTVLMPLRHYGRLLHDRLESGPIVVQRGTIE